MTNNSAPPHLTEVELDSLSFDELRQAAYRQRQAVTALTWQVHDKSDFDSMRALAAAQADLARLEQRLDEWDTIPFQTALDQAAAEDKAAADESKLGAHRGVRTTGLEVRVTTRMTHVPTAFYHLLDAEVDPLVEVRLRAVNPAAGGGSRDIRVTAHIDGYSAVAIDTVEVRYDGAKARNKEQQTPVTVTLLPLLIPERVRSVRELTRASLNVLVEDLRNNRVEAHLTQSLWLLACNAAIFTLRDPLHPDQVKDFRHYLGAFVTPNDPSVQAFLPKVAAHHPDERLSGLTEDGEATRQAAAIYDALQSDAMLAYVNATTAFNPRAGADGQRVRLPRETLREQQANCLDGALLFASLLEALGLDPCLAVVPGHVFAGWRTAKGMDSWQYVDTTVMYGKFQEASTRAANLIAACLENQKAGVPGEWFRRLELSELRGKYGVTPLS